MSQYEKEKMKLYMREYRAKIKKRIILLLGGKCVNCGIENYSNLDIHHIDPKTKKFTIAKNWTRKFEKNIKEIQKCKLLCKLCHENYHEVENNHGTTAKYNQGCRCLLCCNAQSLYRKKYYKEKGK